MAPDMTAEEALESDADNSNGTTQQFRMRYTLFDVGSVRHTLMAAWTDNNVVRGRIDLGHDCSL